jgi:hypothetical protein
MFEDGVNDDISEISIMIKEVLNLIYRISVLTFMMVCLPKALLTPQNEGVNLDLGWVVVNNHTSPYLNIINYYFINKIIIIK